VENISIPRHEITNDNKESNYGYNKSHGSSGRPLSVNGSFVPQSSRRSKGSQSLLGTLDGTFLPKQLRLAKHGGDRASRFLAQDDIVLI